jgi:hypothetical protein
MVGASYEDKCSEIGLSTLEERRWEQDMVQVYKILHGHGGLKSDEFFEKVGDREGPRTRTAGGHDNLKMPRFRSEIRRNSFSIRTVKSWNGLPDSVKQADTVPKFKSRLREFIRNGGRPGQEQLE